MAAFPGKRGERLRSVGTAGETLREPLLVGERSFPARHLVDENARVASTGILPHRRFRALASRRGISLRVQKPGACEQEARRERRGSAGADRGRALGGAPPQRGPRLVELAGSGVIPLGIALQRGRGEAWAPEGGSAAGGPPPHR